MDERVWLGSEGGAEGFVEFCWWGFVVDGGLWMEGIKVN